MRSNAPLSVVILAAGKGTRMKSDKAKVLHEVFFAPMVLHVLKAVLPLSPEKIAVIVGHQRAEVEKALVDRSVDFVIQEEQLGTGHAVLTAEPAIPEGPGTVMILCGDTPLVRTETLQQIHAAHLASKATITLMTTELYDPTNYGRILTDKDGTIAAIVEEKDASEEQRCITEINAGIYCVERDFLFRALKQVGTDNSQGEIYLTDIIALGVNERRRVEKFVTPLSADVLGVNSRVELAQAQREMQTRRNRDLMLSGVTMLAPESVTVAPTVSVGRDCKLMAGCQLLGTTSLLEHCCVGIGAILENCQVGAHVEIGHYCVLKNQVIADGTVIAPLQATLS